MNKDTIKNVNTLIRQGEHELGAKDYERALICFQRAYEIDQTSITAVVNMGFCYAKLEQFSQAKECFIIALDQNPHNIVAKRNLARILDIQGNKEEMSFGSPSSYTDPWKKPLPHKDGIFVKFIELGQECRIRGNFFSAVQYFEAASNIHPEFIDPYLQIAFCYEELYDGEKACATYRQALSIYPDDETAQEGIKRCCEKISESRQQEREEDIITRDEELDDWKIIESNDDDYYGFEDGESEDSESEDGENDDDILEEDIIEISEEDDEPRPGQDPVVGPGEEEPLGESSSILEPSNDEIEPDNERDEEAEMESSLRGERSDSSSFRDSSVRKKHIIRNFFRRSKKNMPDGTNKATDSAEKPQTANVAREEHAAKDLLSPYISETISDDQSAEKGTSHMKTTKRPPFLTQRELKRLLLTISFASFIIPLISSGVTISLPYISSEFVPPASHIGLVQLSFFMVFALFLLPFYKVSERIGKQHILISALFCQLVGFTIAALSISFPMLLVGMALGGFGSAGLLSTAVPLLTTYFPRRERGKVIRINAAIIFTALVLGPFIGGIFISAFGWHSLFWMVCSVTAVSLCLAICIIPKLPKISREPPSHPFDRLGTVLYIIALSLVLIGASRITEESYAISILAIGIVMSLLFLWWEGKHPDPLFPTSIFAKNKFLRSSSLAACIMYGSSFAVALLLSFYLQSVRDFASIEAGAILIVQPLVMVMLTPYAKRLSDRFDPRFFAATGMAMTAISLFVFATLTNTAPLWAVISILIILGCALALFSSSNKTSLMSSVPSSHVDIASRAAESMHVLGPVMSMTIVVIVFTATLGSVVISPETAFPLFKALSMISLILGVLCTAGIWFSFPRMKSRKIE